ncbi:MAG: hypothetical protein RCG15_04940 [Candidatus Rickettsia vulgarisii]
MKRICTIQIEDSFEKLDVAKAYDCLARLEDLEPKPGIYKAIKNASHGLDIIFLKKSTINLYNLIINGYENQIFKLLKVNNSDQIINKYLTGYSKDEIPFLKNYLH